MTTGILAILLFGYLVSSVFVALCANTYGRHAVGWGLIGLVAGPPIAWITLAFIGRNDEVIEERKIRRGSHRCCPRCKELIRTKAEICKWCGTKFKKKEQ